jgi:predicted TIM-barrel fold metal-dependent hydrolase
MPIIDAHTHIYSPDEKRYPPARELLTEGWTGKPMSQPLRPPGGNAAVEDLRRESQSAGVTAACIVQTSTFYRFDNRYICDSARSNSDWVAGICTLDPDDPYSPSVLAHDTNVYRLRGLRSIPGKDGLDSEGVRALWKGSADLGIVVNVLISWTDSKGGWYWGKEHLPGFHRMLEDFPGLPVVLDHCLNIQAGHPQTGDALAALQRLAKYQNVHAKMSWVAAGSRKPFPCSDTHPLCYKIIETFGPERCVWGSAYPSALWTPRLTYRDHLRIFTHELELTSETRAAVLGKTARKLWFRNVTWEI